MTAVRVTCIVPGCHHTRGPRKGDVKPLLPSSEWICSTHWRGLDREDKAENRQDHELLARGIRPTWLAWDRLKAEATEKAAGI